MSEPAEKALTLADMAVGSYGRVLRVDGHGSLRHRVMEMGVTPGCRIKLVRVAPLGDPMDFELRGYHLSLRKNEARHISVEALA